VGGAAQGRQEAGQVFDEAMRKEARKQVTIGGGGSDGAGTSSTESSGGTGIDSGDANISLMSLVSVAITLVGGPAPISTAISTASEQQQQQQQPGSQSWCGSACPPTVLWCVTGVSVMAVLLLVVAVRRREYALRMTPSTHAPKEGQGHGQQGARPCGDAGVGHTGSSRAVMTPRPCGVTDMPPT
jgi:hypothetical protein